MKSLNFEYTNEDIDYYNKIKEMLNKRNIPNEVAEDSNGIHINFDEKYQNDILNMFKRDITFYSENINKINRWFGIDKNGIVIDNLTGNQYAEYQGVALQGNGSNGEKFNIYFQLFNVTDKPVFVVEQYNENTKKYENITYKVSKNTRKKILDKMYEEVNNKELLIGCKQYQKDDLLNNLLHFQSEMLDEDNKSKRQYECKRIYQILSKHLSDNIDELHNLFQKSNILTNNWGETIKSYEVFKKGFEELCKKYNITEQIYDDSFLKDKNGNYKKLNEKFFNEEISKELVDLIMKCNRNENVDIDEIINNSQLQYVISSKDNAGIETIDIPGREGLQNEIALDYLKNVKSADIDKNGKVIYNGNILNERRVEIIIGYPSSGKSTISNQISNLSHARILDSDIVKEKIPEYNAGLGVEKVHKESKKILAKIIEESILNGENAVIPIIGGKTPKLNRLLKQYTEAGYTINLTIVNLPKNKCMARNITRFIETGRLIHPQILYDCNNPNDVLTIIKKDIEDKKENYKYNINTIKEYNNDVPFGCKAELTKAYKAKGSLMDITNIMKMQQVQNDEQFTQNKIKALKM